MTIYHKITCPICKQKLNKTFNFKNLGYRCENQCYTYEKHLHRKKVISVRITIFDERIQIKRFDRELNKMIVFKVNKEIRQQINYWSENSRYLMELITLRSN